MKRQSVSVLIVDDEAPARRLLKRFLESEPDVKIAAECHNGRQAVEAIRAGKPDVVLLDIQMPEMDGFAVIEEIGSARMPVVIFVTAYDNHAIRAFEIHACDYILKPFRKERLTDALSHARELLRQRPAGQAARMQSLVHDWQYRQQHSQAPTAHTTEQFLHRIIVKERDGYRTIELQHLVWIESADHYVVLHTTRGNHLLYDSLKSLEIKLNPAYFVRIHRTALVNIHHVRKIKPNRFGTFEVQMSDHSVLRLSRSRRDQLEPLLLRRDSSAA